MPRWNCHLILPKVSSATLSVRKPRTSRPWSPPSLPTLISNHVKSSSYAAAFHSPSSKFSPPERHGLLQLAHSELGSTKIINLSRIQVCLINCYLAKTPSCLDRSPHRGHLDPLRLELFNKALVVLAAPSQLHRPAQSWFPRRRRSICRLWWLRRS